MADTSLSLTQLGSEPITPEAPCGELARYEPEYESLEAEIAKLGTLAAQGETHQVDWGRVVDLGTVILKEKSKDLLVASYLSRGLFEQQGYQGLVAAFTIYRDLIREYWEILFPAKKRLRGRLAAITWLAESLDTAMERRGPVASEREAVQQCQELLQAIGELLHEKLDQMQPIERDQVLSPLPGRFRRLLTALEQQAEAPAEPPAPAPPEEALAVASEPPSEAEAAAPTEASSEPSAEPVPAVPAASEAAAAPQAQPQPSADVAATTVPSTFETEAEVQRALRSCQTIFRNVATFLLSQDLSNPLPYRLNRIGAWMMIFHPPPNQDGMVQFTGIQPIAVQGFAEALKNEDYAGLIPNVETTCARIPFWLDGHHITVKALEALGPSHAEAVKAVSNELANFLKYVPGLLELKFADGTPFANDETRAWIESKVLAPSARGRTRVARPQQPREVVVLAPTGDVEPQPGWAQIVQKAQQLAAEGKVLEGASLFQDGQKRAASQRERFMWRLQQARFCFEAGLLEVAIPQLEFLQEQGEGFGLDEWEPALSLDVAQLLLRCYYTLAQEAEHPTPELDGKAERLHARLCRLDVTAALAINATA